MIREPPGSCLYFLPPDLGMSLIYTWLAGGNKLINPLGVKRHVLAWNWCGSCFPVRKHRTEAKEGHCHPHVFCQSGWCASSVQKGNWDRKSEPSPKAGRKNEKAQVASPISSFSGSCFRASGWQRPGIRGSYRRWKETKMGEKIGWEGATRVSVKSQSYWWLLKSSHADTSAHEQHWSGMQYCLTRLPGLFLFLRYECFERVSNGFKKWHNLQSKT